MIIAGAWYFTTSFGAPAPTDNEPAASNEPANTEDIVAVVNGEEVSRTQFEAFKSQVIAQQGIDTASLDAETEGQLEAQIVDDLISQAVLRQAVAASGAAAPQEEVDARIEATKTQLGGEEAFGEVLAAEGLSEEGLRTQISSQLATQTYLEQELNLSSITASDEEVEAAYTQAATQDERIPPLEDVRPQVEQSVVQQKQQSVLAQFINQLRTEADIEVLL